MHILFFKEKDLFVLPHQAEPAQDGQTARGGNNKDLGTE
jgi:hypothetical protein